MSKRTILTIPNITIASKKNMSYPDIKTDLSKPSTNKHNFKGRLTVQYAGKPAMLLYSKSFKALEELTELIVTSILDADAFPPLRLLQEITDGTDFQVFKTEEKGVPFFVVSKHAQKKK